MLAWFNHVMDMFQRAFIREDRWKLFLSGVGTTLLITALSAVFGTMIGFFVYLCCDYRTCFGNDICSSSVVYQSKGKENRMVLYRRSIY